LSGDVQQPHLSSSVSDRVALVIATGAGAGYVPWAPGTVGSLLGVGVFWLWGHSFFGGLLVAGLLSLLGVWASGRVEKRHQEADPSFIIIDEIAGQFVALWVPTGIAVILATRLLAGDPLFILMGFVLFRFFDIVKPAPIRRLEKLKRGVGIVADDLAAGIYAGLALQLLISSSMLMKL